MVIYYDDADPKQLLRLSKYVDCIKHIQGKKIECEKAFLNFNIDAIDDIICDDITFVCHAIFNEIGYRPPQNERIKKVIAVSDYAAREVKQYFDVPIEYSYNPISMETYDKPLILCSAFRMNDATKGGNRVRTLIEHLDKYCERTNKHYLYLIFTDKLQIPVESKNVAIMPPRTDVRAYFQLCDWGITLSNNMETYCYTNVEFLMSGVPIVTTPLTVADELKMDSSMRLIIDWDMSNVDDIIEQMFTKKMKFTYSPPNDRWNELLAKGERTTKKMENTRLFKVRALKTSEETDVIIPEYSVEKNTPEGTELIVTEDRLDSLVNGKNIIGKPFVEIIEEVIPERDEPIEKTEKKKATRKKSK